MLSCKDTTRLASEALDRRLGLMEWMGMRFHLMMCIPCSRARRRLHFLRDAARRLGEPGAEENLPGPSLSPEARRRLQEALNPGENPS
jgi:hypothetical protein